MTLYLILLIILLLLSAFFSATEVAFLSLTEAKIDAMVEQKEKRSDLIKQLKKNPRRLLVTILIGNNIVNIAASSIATVVATELFASAAIGIATGVMTLLVLVFGEIIPKALATTHNKTMARFASPVLRLLQWIGFPLIVAFEAMTNLVAGKHTGEEISKEELAALTIASVEQGSLEKEEGAIMERVFEFSNITAEDIMTPRVHVVFIYDNTTIEEATETIEKSTHTRYPIAHDTPDKIIGYVHSRDVLLAFHRDKEHTSIKEILRPIIPVPKQMPIDEVMKQFQRNQAHMAVVVDEFGGTEGIVTFEDIIEELVGEITDEYDINEHMIQRVDKHTIIAAGNTDIRDINDFFNCEIPGDEFDTIAEIILDHLQKFPRKGEKVILGNTECTVLELRKNQIRKVRIIKVM